MLRLVRWWLLVAVLAVGLFFYNTSVANPTIIMRQNWNGLWLSNAVRLGVWFVAGVLIAEVSHLVVRRHLVAVGALALAVIGIATHQAMVAIPPLACLIIYVGTLPCRPAERLHRLGDPSYGMYLSGFVVQQVLVWAGLVRVHQPWLSFVEGADPGHRLRLRLLAPGREAGHAPGQAPGVRARAAAAARPPDEPSGGVVEAVEQMAHPLPLGA